jgi:D-methionine transport system ATP-binding protein
MSRLMLEISGLRKVFPNGVVALDGVDLSVPAGEIVGVIGRSGTGKSTLIRCVNRLEEPTAGTITLEGADLTRMRGAELRAARRRIGMIFQQFNLLTSRTAAENVALPLEIAGVGRAERRRRAHELLDLVGLGDRTGAYPAQLSGGQKQRVGIARALASEPALLLSDEATSALDAETTHSVLDLLRQINAELGLTVLLITHEMDVVRAACDRVALLDAGRVVEHGPLGEVVARPGSRLAAGLLPSLGRVEVADDEHGEEVVLFDDADERLAAAVADGARIEARATERIGDRRVTRALVVTPKGVAV